MFTKNAIIALAFGKNKIGDTMFNTNIENNITVLDKLTRANENFDIIKVERPIEYKTVFERVEDGETKILDETEKEYLKAVIKPFKNKVKSISKLEGFRRDTEYLTIYFEDNNNIGFPDFEIGTMYKGMKRDKEYTLKELELDYED